MTDVSSPEGPDTSALDDEARQRMLRLVTKSFCREIIDYGVSVRDLLKVSGHVLDFASHQADQPQPPVEHAFGRFALDDVTREGDAYRMGGVSLRPLGDDDLPLLARWVSQDDIRTSVLVPYPTREDDLRSHLDGGSCAYHLILMDGEAAGLIGAEEIDRHSRRAEMRKFIGEPAMRGRGLGTEATFLWLYHAFDALDLNKVYIHTHHANARNLKLNRSLGFEVEGVLSEEHLLDGAFVDIVRMGLLRQRWRELVGWT